MKGTADLPLPRTPSERRAYIEGLEKGIEMAAGTAEHQEEGDRIKQALAPVLHLVKSTEATFEEW